jgi:signal transduction histidine kinase
MTNADDDALREWRRRATDIVIAAAVFLHLPGVVLLLRGYGPAVPSRAKVLVLSGYLVSVVFALFRWMDYRVRVWALLVFLYSIALVGSATFPQGPYLRVLPIVAPILAIGLLGVPAARVTTLISAGVLMFPPLVHTVPGAGVVLGLRPAPLPVPAAQIWLQAVGLVGEMVILMVLLERFSSYLLQSLAAERRAAAESARAHRTMESEIEERRRLERDIARIGEDDRRRLGQEVHDGVSQQITAALLRCQALELHLEKGAPPTSEEVKALSSLLSEAIDDARAVAQGLCPLQPSPDALAPALRALARRTQQMSGVPCDFYTLGDVRVPEPATAQHLYRIAQEALSNAVRHARAVRIAMRLQGTDEGLLLQVDDDGTGLPAEVPPGGMGLRTMAWRAHVLEGTFEMKPAPAGGTSLSCRIPRSTPVASASGAKATATGVEP